MRLDLPVHLTPFVGRGHELQDLAELLPTARLLTLTGAGGSGKTRLARELTVRIAPEFERVGWVDLAAIQDAELIPQRIAPALQLPERTRLTPRERVEPPMCRVRPLLVPD